jgi:DNA-binding MarR family transcriptional regulator
MERIWGYNRAVEGGRVGDLERIVRGAVAITDRAIAAAGADLTFVQWRVLLIVGERDEGVSISEIASRIGGHASPASRLISRLKRRGIVVTEKGELDARVTTVRLTPTGAALRGRVLDYRRRELEGLLLGVPTLRDQETIARLARVFGSLG